MVEIYRSVGGMKLEKFIAYLPESKAAIHEHTAHVGAVAKELKQRHVETRASFVEVEYGELDGHVVLNDEAGQKAAMAMEYGSGPHEGFPDGTPAQGILHEAAGLPFKASYPRSRRRKKYLKQSNRRKRH